MSTHVVPLNRLQHREDGALCDGEHLSGARASKRQGNIQRFLTLFLVLCLWKVGEAQTILLEGNFNDNFLDPDTWTVNLNIPQGGASVTKINQFLRLINRGYLVTVDEFDPLTVGGLRISGRFTFTPSTSEDVFTVLTRTDGVPDPNHCCGGAQHGIQVSLGDPGSPGTLEIQGRGAVTCDYAVILDLDVNPGDTFDFVVSDDGLNVSITVTEVGGDGITSTLATTCTTASPANHVAFHNRERIFGNNVGRLDNVRIETLPSSQHVGGSVTSLTPTSVTCSNTTTGQSIVIKPRAPSWDCEAAGLVVNPGDRIRQTIGGTAH
jgi:hypothetical protein